MELKKARELVRYVLRQNDGLWVSASICWKITGTDYTRLDLKKAITGLVGFHRKKMSEKTGHAQSKKLAEDNETFSSPRVHWCFNDRVCSSDFCDCQPENGEDNNE